MSDRRSNLNRKIKTVHLVNFQNHLDTKINFENGMNLLVGTSDSGKTAIARAISYVINNDMDGTDFIHHGKKKAEIEIEFCDGAIIRRSKAKDFNRVEYKYADTDDWIMKSSFGTKYPEDIIEFLGNPPSFDKLEAIAYSDQNNKNFLIDIAPGSLPEVISKIIDIDDLENGAKLLSSKVKQLDKDVKNLNNKISEDKDTLILNFSELDEKQKKRLRIEKLFSAIDELEKIKSSLEAFRDKFLDLNKKGNDRRKKLNLAIKLIDNITPLSNELENRMEELTAKNNLNSQIITTNQNIAKNTSILNVYRVLDTEENTKLVNNLDGELSVLGKGYNLEQSIKSNTLKINSKKSEIEKQNKIINVAKDEIDLIWQKVKDEGLVCDTCNSFGGITL